MIANKLRNFKIKKRMDAVLELLAAARNIFTELRAKESSSLRAYAAALAAKHPSLVFPN
jgi:hypothetical protein